jgi:hypothetical protein
VTGVKASYDLKVDRAEEHLVHIEQMISEYVDSHPYEVPATTEGPRLVATSCRGG